MPDHRDIEDAHSWAEAKHNTTRLRRGEPAWLWGRRLGTALLALAPVALLTARGSTSSTTAEADSLITGTVCDVDRHPVAGARVRVQTTEVLATTDSKGYFMLRWHAGRGPVTVTAWAAGRYVGWASATPGGAPVSITLKPYYTTDNEDYGWFTDDGATGSVACSHCMVGFNDWLKDAHSRSALNPRFLSMYNGTDLDGHQSPPTQFVLDAGGGRIPTKPNPSTPYFGPGFKLDFPTQTGSCGACHLLVAASRHGGAYAADPNRLDALAKEGVACEFCHKIGEVKLDPLTHLPDPDRPGVLSVRLYRPADGQQLFFGQFDDVTRRVSYLPLEEESAFCAPCHYGVFSGVTVYNSYGEWLASPYSDPRRGKTCQSCHMPVAGDDYFVFPEKGGLRRNPARILDHRMPGAASEGLLRNAVTMTIEAKHERDRLTVVVRITNDKTGHDVPTDSPLRHLILLVEARGAEGNSLPQLDGSKVPSWGGVGRAEEGNYAGLPGKAFAKVLEEVGTRLAPTGAYWNRTTVVSDNRIAAFATDTSSYSFKGEAGAAATVEVRLLFRRAFKELAKLKGWPDSDIVMATQTLVVNPEPLHAGLRK